MGEAGANDGSQMMNGLRAASGRAGCEAARLELDTVCICLAIIRDYTIPPVNAARSPDHPRLSALL